MSGPTVATVIHEVTVTLHMDEDIAERLKALLLVSVSWADQEWAQRMYEALVEAGLRGTPANIESQIYNAVHSNILGAHNMQHVCDDDYLHEDPESVDLAAHVEQEYDREILP